MSKRKGHNRPSRKKGAPNISGQPTTSREGIGAALNRPTANIPKKGIINPRTAIIVAILLMGAGALGAAFRNEIIGLISGEDNRESEALVLSSEDTSVQSADTTSKSDVQASLPEIEATDVIEPEWAKKITLPSVEESAKPWSAEEIRKHFIPAHIPQERIENFYKTFDDLTKQLFDALPDTQDSNALVEKYVNLLINSLLTPADSQLSPEGYIELLNKVLIPYGYWIDVHIELGSNAYTFVLYKVDKVTSVKGSFDDKTIDVPVVFIYDRQNIKVDPNSGYDEATAGQHSPEGGYITEVKGAAEPLIAQMRKAEKACKANGIPFPQMDDQEMSKILHRMLIDHEFFHAVTSDIVGKRPKNTVVQPMDVNMGHYTMVGASYRSKLTALDIDELGANGFGMIHGEKLTNILLYALYSSATRSTPQYLYALSILMYEVIYLPSIDSKIREEFKSKFNSRKATDVDVLRIIMSMSQEDAAKIAERMAKLCIHETQELNK